MPTLVRKAPVLRTTRSRVVLWLALGGVLASLLVLLTGAVKQDPTPSVDRTVIAWVSGWDLPGLSGFFKGINAVTANWPAAALGLLAVALLWLAGKSREARGLAIIGGVVGVIAFAGDYSLGAFVGRPRPLLEAPESSFPSGHVFGTTAFFGFVGFLAVHWRLRRRYLIPVLAVSAAMILSAAPARMHTQVHWPSDIAAGYLLGTLWLLAVIPAFLYVRRAGWLLAKERPKDGSARRVELSFASQVVLDPEKKTATKVYKPPVLFRLLYWLAFQARFPYQHSEAALQAAVYHRKIAGLLTRYRFGTDLVSPVIAVDKAGGKLALVTELVSGEKPENDEATKQFLEQVTETFAEAGLPIWQVNPRNPHAYTNLIRTPEGDLKIIDLESAVVTPVPPRGRWRSALRRGAFPVFDDIDFGRLRSHIQANRDPFQSRLGPRGMAELQEAVEQGEQAFRAWKDSEPRIWGRLIRLAYRLLG